MDDIKTVAAVLDLNVAPHRSQQCTDEASAGLHRVAVVNLLGQLMEAGCPAIDNQCLSQAVHGRLIALFFQYPWNSILQGSLCRFFLVSQELLFLSFSKNWHQMVLLLWKRYKFTSPGLSYSFPLSLICLNSSCLLIMDISLHIQKCYF